MTTSIPQNEMQFGLRPLPAQPKGKRDYSHSKVFGAAALPSLPSDFLVIEPLEIKNQDINYPSDFCAAYAVSEASEDQENVPFVPEWLFAQAKKIQAEDQNLSLEEAIQAYGLDLRTACKAAVKVGSLDRSYDPYHCTTPDRPARDFLADWRNWPADLAQLAWDFAKGSFWIVDGPYDVFDNIRSALFLNKPESRTVITGATWRRSWTLAPGGMIPRTYEATGGGHAFKVFGWKMIGDCGEGEPYLIVQGSNGTGVGDNGLFYFSREVVNREFTYGSFTLKDMPLAMAKYYHANKISVNDSKGARLLKVIAMSILRAIKLILK